MIRKGNSNNASKVLIGDREASKVYMGSNLVWPKKVEAPIVFCQILDNEGNPADPSYNTIVSLEDIKTANMNPGVSGFIKFAEPNTFKPLSEKYNFCITPPFESTSTVDIDGVPTTLYAQLSEVTQFMMGNPSALKEVLCTDEFADLSNCEQIGTGAYYAFLTQEAGTYGVRYLETIEFRLKNVPKLRYIHLISWMYQSPKNQLFPKLKKISLGLGNHSITGTLCIADSLDYRGDIPLETLEFYRYDESSKEWVLGMDFTPFTEIKGFYYFSKLVNLSGLSHIRFYLSLQESINLSQESLNGVFEALDDLSVEGKTVTLSLSTSHQSKVSDTQIAEATQKGWNVTFR